MGIPDDALYVKEVEVARMLRHDITWLRANAGTLEKQYGLPKVDPAIGMRHRGAIEEWARERNARRQDPRQHQGEENWNAF